MTPVTALLLGAAYLTNLTASTLLARRRGYSRTIGILTGAVLGLVGLLLLAIGRRKPHAPEPAPGFWYQRPDILLAVVSIGLYGAVALRYASGAENVITGGDLETGLVAAIETAEPDVGPFRVDCPDVRRRQGAVAFCDLTTEGRTGQVRITLQDDDGHFTWEVVPKGEQP